MEAGQFRGKEGLSVRILYCIFRRMTHTSFAYTGRVINLCFMPFVVKALPFRAKTAPQIFAICGDSRARPYWLGKTGVQGTAVYRGFACIEAFSLYPRIIVSTNEGRTIEVRIFISNSPEDSTDA